MIRKNVRLNLEDQMRLRRVRTAFENEPGQSTSSFSQERDRSEALKNQALSLAYMSTTLMEEMADEGIERSAPVKSLKKIILRKGEATVCPVDGKLGSSYVHAVSGEANGPATAMLSYTWRYAVGEIVDTLQQHCRDEALPPETTHIWMCCFCVNQHRVMARRNAGTTVPFEEFKQEFGSRVKRVGNMISLMSP